MRVNSFTIGSFTATANQHVAAGGNNIKLFGGLQSPLRRVSSFDLSGQSGAFVTGAFYGARVLTIKVEIIGSTVSDFGDRVNTMIEAFDLENGEAEMTIVDKDGDSYTVSGYGRIVSDGPGFGELKRGVYTFEFFCQDHRILSATASTYSLGLSADDGGAAIPTEVPMTLEASTGGSVVVTNDGNTEAHLIIQLNGPLTANVSIRNVTTDKRMIYQADIATGKYVTIDTRNKTVLDDLGANVIGNCSSVHRDFFTLQPGDNNIVFDHDDVYNATASADLTWYDSYIGI